VTQPLGSPLIVLDTNIVLDLFIFSDPRCDALKLALNEKRVQWISTQVMRDELERVLAYTHLQPRMAFYKVTASDVLQQFDVLAQLHDTAPRAMYVCKDTDDQKFIDLAVQHRGALISKDKAVLTMRKRLANLNVVVAVQWDETAVLVG
jgi:putative PIN family toxin of toxin-antitoxin system